MNDIVKIDDNTLIKTIIVEERIDIGDLKIEKIGIEEQLAQVMTDEQLLEWARKERPQPDTSVLQTRLDEINKLLEI